MDLLRAAACVALLALGGVAPAAHASQGNVAPVGPPHLAAASDDGSQVFLETGAALAVEDTDAEADVYVIDAGTPRLLSIGPAGGNAPLRPATFEDASADGARVLFTTREALVAADGDTTTDIYEHSGGQTTLLTSAESAFLAMTRDGAHVFFSTAQSLAAEDADATEDIYGHVAGVSRLVSVGPGGANVSQSSFAGSSADGSRAWFTTREPLVPADGDANGLDVYERSEDATRLVTDWPAASGGAADASFAGAADDGARVFVRTAGAVTPDDTDAAADVFEVGSSGTTLLSTGPADAPGGSAAQFRAATPDGSRVYFTSGEVLVAGRPSGVFERAGGVTTWLGSTAPSLQSSADGSATYFVTGAALVPQDTNPGEDLYLRAAGETLLVSETFTAVSVRVEAVSSDGGAVFLLTPTPLDPADADSADDLYALRAGRLYLMSGGPTSWPSAPPGIPRTVVVPDGSRAFFETFDRLTAVDGDSELDVYASEIPDESGYPRPKAASPLHLALVPAFERCTAANATHGPPLAFGSCSPPARVPGRLTVGTPDVNGETADAAGFVRMGTILGDPATPEDEADVRVVLSATDVREATDLTDYTGELELSLVLRVTDRDGTSAPAAPSTEEDAELSFAASCVATADAATGSACTLDTTAESLVPGIAVERQRAIWAHEAVRVFDGGADGQAATLADNSLFQVPGVFIP